MVRLMSDTAQLRRSKWTENWEPVTIINRFEYDSGTFTGPSQNAQLQIDHMQIATVLLLQADESRPINTHNASDWLIHWMSELRQQAAVIPGWHMNSGLGDVALWAKQVWINSHPGVDDES